MNKQCRVLIIDHNNFFIRSYIADPSISNHGEPCGGLVGSLKSLQKIVRETRPDRIIVVWDGEGGSLRRKTLQKNYKQGRKPLRLNRNYDVSTEKEELRNKIWQMRTLKKYYELLPIDQFCVESVEADDVISYVTINCLTECKKIIVSSDKDFIQLVNKDTILYRPVQKEILNVQKIIEKYGIHPNNFALARSICGDKSDNVIGIKGAGLSTIAKRFSFLKESESFLLKDIIKHCKNVDNKQLKIYENVLKGEKQILNNYRIIQLASSFISSIQREKIKYQIYNGNRQFNKTMFLKKMLHDGIEYNFENLFQTMAKIRDWKV